MHFTASPATYFTAAYERILFTKHSSGSAFYLLQSHSRHECRTSIGALEDADLQQCKLRARRAACNATSDPRFGLSIAKGESVRGGPRYVGMAVHSSRHAAFETRRVKIGRGAGKKVSGSRTMDLFTVVIIAAMLLTVGAVFLGVLSMSAGGSTDDHFSTRFMWARVGFSVLTLLLLFIAARLR
jgi:hypothetical protein